MIDKQIKNWIMKAMEDFNIAKHELSFPENEVSTGPVCFHCQQVIEAKECFEIASNVKEFLFKKLAIKENEVN